MPVLVIIGVKCLRLICVFCRSAKKLKAISDEIVGALKQNPHVQAEVITKLEQTVNMFFTKAFSDLGEN
jgi:hypothetical protein